MSKCILPYKECPYRNSGDCSDLQDAPYNGDAACYRLSGKKKMLLRLQIAILGDNEPIFARLKELGLNISDEGLERYKSHLESVARATYYAELQDTTKEEIIFWSSNDEE